MFKKLILGLALAGLFSAAHAAGTIPYSLSQQLDKYGKPLAGCRLYIIQAGTTSAPQNAYQDAALTLPRPNPMICDAAGRLPQFFVADGTVKVRLANSSGVNQVEVDGIQVIGPSGGGGGGGGTVDPTTVIQTGDVKSRYGTGALAGFVRMNGRTVGSASSGATERANSDTQSLFEYLWNTDSTLVVSGGRGISSNADWVANKTLTLPDGRGRVLAGLDDMGGVSSGRLTSTYFGGTPTTLGAVGGSQTQLVQPSQLPSYSPPISNPLGGTTYVSGVNTSKQTAVLFTGTGASVDLVDAVTTDKSTPLVSPLGSGIPLTTLPPSMLVTNYMKL